MILGISRVQRVPDCWMVMPPEETCEYTGGRQWVYAWAKIRELRVAYPNTIWVVVTDDARVLRL